MIPTTAKANPFFLRRHLNFLLTILSVVVFLTFFCWAVQYSLIIPLLILFLGLYLQFFQKANFKIFLNLGLLLTLLIFTTHLVIEYATFSYFYIPVAAAAMLTVLLFKDLQLGFLISLLGSILATLIAKADLNLMLVFFLGGVTGILAVREARNRSRIISAGLLVSFVQVLCLTLLSADPHFLTTQFFIQHQLRPLFLNGFIAAFSVMATLKIFEYLFGAVTNFSLLELSDFNHPLLKKMILEAPGTYHHSLVVSNLAEAAANAIGGDSLLARVGAYYHDIGKLNKPEYFVENQLGGKNKHDDLEPSISRLLVLNHVKEGIELAKKYKLNQAIVDFIPQHHGTSLMHYFYQRALEETKESQVINEENFRYPGPKPQSRETAIVLLADSVEGATRSLDDPTPSKIEETVKKVINNKFIDGQLDECNLTLKEINTISATFTRVLGAMHHVRVKYPEKKNGNSSRKQTDKNSPSPRRNS